MTDKTSVADWSETASENDNIAGIPLAENTMRPKNVNNFARTIMAQAKAGFQPKDADLTALAGLTSAADKLPYFTGANAASVTTLTSFARALLDDTSASEARTTLGVQNFVSGPASATDGNLVAFDGTTGKLVTDSGKSASDFATAAQGTLADSAVQPSEVRELLTADRTYYVRADGSDGNDGLANTAAGAFLTIRHAVNAVYALDLNGFDVTIQLEDGTWTEAVVASGPFVGKGTVTILGNTTTPANVVWNVTSNRDLDLKEGAKVTVSGIEFRTTTSGECLTAEGQGSQITIGSAIRFGTCAGVHLFAYGGGYVLGRTSYSIVGSASCHFLGQVGGTVDVQGITITLTGTPAFSDAFAKALTGGLVLGGFNTFSGSATGVRYQALTGGGIDSNAGGATYFPGNSAGSATSPGWYN